MRNLSIAMIATLGVVAAGAPAALAHTYKIPSDYGVACLDLDTGSMRWRREGTFTRPRLRIEAGRLVVEDPPPRRRRGVMDPLVDPRDEDSPRQKELLDPATGEPATAGDDTVVVEPLAPLETELRTASGETLAFDPGNTRHLETTDGTVLQRLEWYPGNLLVLGDIAIVRIRNLGGSNEIYGWDLAAGALAWEIDLDREIPELPPDAHVDLALDGTRLRVSVDEWILTFSLRKRPRLLWKTELPRQPIRDYDAAWTTFARHGKVLFALVYEDLFALRAKDGALLWRFDAGMLGDPWPLVHDGKVYVSYRVEQARWTTFRSPCRRIATNLLRIQGRGERWAVTTTARSKIRRRARVWSFLHPPPAPRAGRPRVVLTLHDDDESIAIDLTTAVARGKTAYVKFHGLYDRAELHADDRLLVETSWE